VNYSFSFAAETPREGGMTNRFYFLSVGLQQMKPIMPSAT
jgi:hypothetical protein